MFQLFLICHIRAMACKKEEGVIMRGEGCKACSQIEEAAAQLQVQYQVWMTCSTSFSWLPTPKEARGSF